MTRTDHTCAPGFSQTKTEHRNRPFGKIMQPVQESTTQSPYYRRGGFSIYHGNCLDVLPEVASASIDFVLTDPPYLVNYRGRWDGEKKAIIGDNDSGWVTPAFAQVMRVMKDDCLCFSFYGFPHADIFVGVWKALGFRIVSHVAFVKNVWGLGRFTRGQHETAYLLAKGNPAIPEKPISDVVEWEREADAFHPNQKPDASLYPSLAPRSIRRHGARPLHGKRKHTPGSQRHGLKRNRYRDRGALLSLRGQPDGPGSPLCIRKELS